MVKYLFALCVLLLNGYPQVSAHIAGISKTISDVSIESNSDQSLQGNTHQSELRQSSEGPNYFLDIDATDVEEEENEIASHLLVLASSKFLTALVSAIFFLFLFISLRKGNPFYSRSTITASFRWYVLFQVFRI